MSAGKHFQARGLASSELQWASHLRPASRSESSGFCFPQTPRRLASFQSPNPSHEVATILVYLNTLPEGAPRTKGAFLGLPSKVRLGKLRSKSQSLAGRGRGRDGVPGPECQGPASKIGLRHGQNITGRQWQKATVVVIVTVVVTVKVGVRVIILTLMLFSYT